MCSQEMYILIEWERQKQMRKRSECRGTKAAGKGEGVRWGLGAETINRFSLWGWPLHKHLEKKTDWAMRSGRSLLREEETPGQRFPKLGCTLYIVGQQGNHGDWERVSWRWGGGREATDEETIRFYKAVERCWLLLEWTRNHLRIWKKHVWIWFLF